MSDGAGLTERACARVRLVARRGALKVGVQPGTWHGDVGGFRGAGVETLLDGLFVLGFEPTAAAYERRPALVVGLAGVGVDVERDGFRAAAESLRLDRENNLISLEGAVVLQSGDVLLSGISATFDLESGAVNINNDTSERVSGALLSQ